VPVPPTGGSLSGQVGFKWRRRLFGQLPSRQLLANAAKGVSRVAAYSLDGKNGRPPVQVEPARKHDHIRKD
jgi:hypothetical protein